MKINGYEIKIPAEKIKDIRKNHTLTVELIDENFEGYKNLSEGDKKALKHLVAAAKIVDDIALTQDNSKNIAMKKGLEDAAKTSDEAAEALWLFNSFAGVAAHNGIDKEPMEIFEGIRLEPGHNFYPEDLSIEEFHNIIGKMLNEGKIDELKKILSARTMVERNGDELKAIDYTEYFAPEFSVIANELEVAAHYTTDEEFKDYLGWQAQALLQNNENMDMLADKHWAVLQDCPLEFTLSRENYDDEITPTIFDNKELNARLSAAGIEVNPKDTLGARAGIVNKEGTDLILKFKEMLPELAKKMPYSDEYHQHITHDNKQTAVDVDLAALCGDYAQCRGGMTTAQNLPNSDKLSVKTGGGRRNVFHRQVRQEKITDNTIKILNEFVSPELHKYYEPGATHLFVIGHENAHTLGPDSSYKTALGVYQHIIEENKADVASLAMLPEYVKAGVIDEETLKTIYTSCIMAMFLPAEPVLQKPHRVADLMQFNYLLNEKAISFVSGKMEIDFKKVPEAMYGLLSESIRAQLSKDPNEAKKIIDKYAIWSETSQKIADFKKKLGVKNYREIITHF